MESARSVAARTPDSTEVRIHLIGDLRVARAGEDVILPASKRTRALLGYLIALGTPQLRQSLCDLLWDGPDDPRGSLRWSLSKLRAVIDDASAVRLSADRERVAFLRHGAFIDLRRVQDLLSSGVERTELIALEEAAQLLQGEFLDGLDLPACHRFHHWCMAERERVGALRRKVLGQLVEQTRNDPVRSLPHAHALVAAAPLSESAHATLIRLLTMAGRRHDAEAHCQRASEMLRREVGAAAADTLSAAFRTARRHEHSAAPLETQDAVAAEEPRPAPASQLLRPTLIGRHGERRCIAEAVSALPTGDDRGLLLFVGEPGIGKTHLLEDLTTQAIERGARVAYARCFEAEMIRPYGCFTDALRGMAEFPVAAGAGDREELLASIVAFVHNAAEAQPFVLILDDLQWIDEASAALLHVLARTAIPRFLLASAARSGEIEDNFWAKRLTQSLAHDSLLKRMPLGALDCEQTARLTEIDPRSEDAAETFRHSGGNPLLALELARAQAHGTDFRGQGIERLVADRLARLGEEERGTLVWAAAIGREFHLDLLGSCIGMPGAGLFGRIERLERFGLLRPTYNGNFDFAHDLVRQSVYRLQPQPYRRFLHRRIALALSAMTEHDPSLHGDLAHHAGLAEDHATAARACVAAGEGCLRLFASAQAEDAAERGLAHLQHLPAGRERIRRTIELLGIKAFARAGAGGRDPRPLLAALDVAVDAAALSGLYGEAANALHIAAWLHQNANDTEGARQATLRAEKISRTADIATHCHQLANTGRCLLDVESSIPRALALIHEAEAIAEASNLQFVELEWGRALAARWDGDLDEAGALMRRALDFARLREDRWREGECLVWLATIALERSDFGDMAARCDELARMGSALGPIVGALRALADLAASDPDASAHLQVSLAELRALDDKARLAHLLNTGAALSLQEGDHAGALAAANEALEVAHALRRPTEIAVAGSILARVAAAQGDMDGAVLRLRATRAETSFQDLSARARLQLTLAARTVGEPL